MLIACPKCQSMHLDQCTENHIICLNESCNASYKLELNKDKTIKSWRESGQKTYKDTTPDVPPPTVNEIEDNTLVLDVTNH